MSEYPQSKMSKEVEDFLNLLNEKGSGMFDEIPSKKKTNPATSHRPVSQPSSDPISIRSDNLLYDNPTNSNSNNGNMLVEAALVPNLSYVGIGVKPKSRQQSNRPVSKGAVHSNQSTGGNSSVLEQRANNQGGSVTGDQSNLGRSTNAGGGGGASSGNEDLSEMCLFYPNGTKSISMRSSIQESMRRIRQESLINPSQNNKKQSSSRRVRGKQSKNGAAIARNTRSAGGQRSNMSYADYLEKEDRRYQQQTIPSQDNREGNGQNTQSYNEGRPQSRGEALIKPLRTSLLDRPFTASSTTSIMKQRGNTLEVQPFDKRPYSAGEGLYGLSSAELKQSLRNSHGRLQIAMMHRNPESFY